MNSRLWHHMAETHNLHLLPSEEADIRDAAIVDSPPKQICQFADELDALVNRYRKEADFSYAEVVGALNMRMWTLMHEAQDRADEILPDITDMDEETP